MKNFADELLPFLLLFYISWKVGPWWLWIAYIAGGFVFNVAANLLLRWLRSKLHEW